MCNFIGIFNVSGATPTLPSIYNHPLDEFINSIVVFQCDV